MGKDKKIDFGWSIWNARIGIYFNSFTDTRGCAIGDHEARVGRPWKDLRKDGDRAVRVRIEVISHRRTYAAKKSKNRKDLRMKAEVHLEGSEHPGAQGEREGTLSQCV